LVSRLLTSTACVIVAALAAAPYASAAPTPPERALYRSGPDGRFLLDAGWSARADPRGVGLREGWQRQGRRAGFRPVSVPHSFNARDRGADGFRSRVQWYRTSFRLPAGGSLPQWRLRFESVNRRAQVWLNGRRVGAHEGAHLPFELPARGLRRGDNELVVRVDGRLSRTDLPPAPRPQGWWNHGGILREVYLRRGGDLDLADLDLRPANSGRVEVRAVVRNTTSRSLPLDYTVEVTGPGGAQSFPVRGGSVGPGALGRIETTLQVASPQLWSPERPSLYEARVRLGSGQVSTAPLGFREWTRDGEGRVLLNGRPLSLRGASFHEQTRTRGQALTAGDRAAVVRQLQSIGADVTRQHYPPHPALLEAFDRAGIIFWEQIPVWRVRGAQLRGRLRREALERLRGAVVRDRNHPSVMAWSIANEPLGSGSIEAGYVSAANALVDRLDPTRLLVVDKAMSPGTDIPDYYRQLDAIGLTEYFGWYGRSRVSELRPALDRIHARFPGVGLFVTEFGAEANRGGGASTKGTFAFQRSFTAEQLAALDGTPYLSGAITWLLRDFAVRPGWAGGNPRAKPPVNYKGVFTERGAPKPVAAVVRERFVAVPSTRDP
jgi:hypothetical protein